MFDWFKKIFKSKPIPSTALNQPSTSANPTAPNQPIISNQPSTSANTTRVDLSDSNSNFIKDVVDIGNGKQLINFKIQKLLQRSFTIKHIDSQLNIIMQLLENRMYVKKYLKNQELLKNQEFLKKNEKIPIMGGQDEEPPNNETNGNSLNDEVVVKDNESDKPSLNKEGVVEYNGIYYGVWAEMYYIKKLKNEQDKTDSKTFLSKLEKLQPVVKYYSSYVKKYRLNPLYTSMNTSIEALIIVCKTGYTSFPFIDLKEKVISRFGMLVRDKDYGLPENDDEMEKELNKMENELNEMENELNEMEKELNEMTKELNNNTEELNKIYTEISSNNLNYENFNKTENKYPLLIRLKTILNKPSQFLVKLTKYDAILKIYKGYLEYKNLKIISSDSKLITRVNDLIIKLSAIQSNTDSIDNINTLVKNIKNLVETIKYETNKKVKESNLKNTAAENQDTNVGGRRRRKTMNKQRKTKKAKNNQRKTKKARK